MSWLLAENPKLLLNVDSSPDINVSRNVKEYYELLNKRIKYLQDILFNFKSQRLAMINKNRENFQYKGGDLVYIISPLTSQLRTKLMENSSKIYRPSCNLQNCRSPQLFINDIRWKNVKRNL